MVHLAAVHLYSGKRKKGANKRVTVGGLCSRAISQASVNRMSQTHWELEQEVKEGGKLLCFQNKTAN